SPRDWSAFALREFSGWIGTLVYQGHLALVGRVLLAGATGLGMDARRDDMRSHPEAPGQRPRCVRFAARLLGIGVAALMTAACGGGSGPATPSATSSSAASGSASSLAPIHGTYAPKIDPSNFVATIDN